MDDAQKEAARDRAKDRLFENILRLEDEVTRLRADLSEQCCLNGMGSEREARLLAKLDAVQRTVESQHREIVASQARSIRMVELMRKLREPDWHLESIREFQRELRALEDAVLSDDSALREMIEAARKGEREACIEDVRTVGGSFAVQCEELIRARGAQ